MIRWWVFLCTLLAGPAFAASRASALLDAAREHSGNLEVRQAVEKAQAALTAGDARADETWSIHALLGELQATLGKVKDAEESFGRALELHPSYELPVQASPKLREPYQRAKERVAGRRLAATVSSSLLPDGQVRSQVKIQGDAYRLVEGGLLHRKNDPTWSSASLAKAETLTGLWQCEHPPCAYYVTLQDARGNTLLSAGDPHSPLFAERAWVEGPAFYKKPVPWFIAAGAMAAISTFFFARWIADEQTMATVDRNRLAYTPAQAQTADGIRRRDHALALGFLGGALATGTVGLVLHWH